ncbi:hypothetical protein AAY473_016960 [Plecturocebus cupreus]
MQHLMTEESSYTMLWCWWVPRRTVGRMENQFASGNTPGSSRSGRQDLHVGSWDGWPTSLPPFLVLLPSEVKSQRQGLVSSPRLECRGSTIAHCSLELLDSTLLHGMMQ